MENKPSVMSMSELLAQHSDIPNTKGILTTHEGASVTENKADAIWAQVRGQISISLQKLCDAHDLELQRKSKKTKSCNIDDDTCEACQ